MKKIRIKQTYYSSIAGDMNQKGSAIVIALFVLALISVFVALALSRSSAEAAAVGNETAEGRTFYAAQGSLETMTRNFNKVFEIKLNPSNTDLDAVRNGTVPGLNANYTFSQELQQTSDSTDVVLSGGPFTGLYAIRDSWRLRTTATNNTGVQVQLTRNVLNNRVPIFQFGIFSADDLELFRPPRFSFGGRVHSNGNFFVSPGAEGVYFDSRVTAVGHVVTQTWRNWNQSDIANSQTFIKNASNTFVQLLPDRGSVLNTTAGAANNVFAFPPAVPVPVPTPNLDLPPSRLNPNWTTQSAIFDGNLQSRVPALKLPLNIGATTDLVEIINRGKEIPDGDGGDLVNNSGTLQAVTTATQDNLIMRIERFANKTGIRVSLADSKAKLPGCASGIGTAAVTGVCGVRLDGHFDGAGGDRTALPSPLPAPIPAVVPYVRGYQPKSMQDGYSPTRLNGERFYIGGTREVWIKIETVQTNALTGAIETKDITQDILSLGVTEEAPSTLALTAYAGSRADNGTATSPSLNLTATDPQSASTYPDSRSVLKLQRFSIPGPAIPGGNNVLFSYGTGSAATNVVRRYTVVGNINAGCPTSGSSCLPANLDVNAGSLERYGHLKRATAGAANVAVVPFPIEIFDTREGEHYDERSATYYSNLSNLTRNGVMSMIDIDVANLRRFFRGDFNGLFPVDTPFAISNGGALTNASIPQREGWVLYVSDRRGDEDFDGQFDMEDVYGAGLGNDGTMQLGEDANRNGLLDTLYGTEAERYNTNTIAPDLAAVNDHRYYRRGVRLINGTVVPGVFDSVTPGNTRGFTVASENGIYVEGNYNATGVSSVPATGNTPFTSYLPFNTATHVPASIVGDAVTLLSNAWNDAQSFSSPYDQSGRLASTTQMRFAMISGDTIASREASPNQGGVSPRLNGGVHNFKRFLERWSVQRLDYAGSLINLYNSRNNNGSFKCCNTVYNPPVRNWVFDGAFLDPSRLPPGTPFFQYVQTTGFQRTND